MRIVYPQFSPNGHIVFVALYKPFSDEDVWSNYEHDDAAYDDFREHQEELQWERMRSATATNLTHTGTRETKPPRHTGAASFLF